MLMTFLDDLGNIVTAFILDEYYSWIPFKKSTEGYKIVKEIAIDGVITKFYRPNSGALTWFFILNDVPYLIRDRTTRGGKNLEYLRRYGVKLSTVDKPRMLVGGLRRRDYAV